MSVLLHFAIALAYITVTAAVAVGLPQIVLGIDQMTAVLLAALGVLLGGLVHLGVVHAARGRKVASLARNQAQLSKSFAEMRKAVAEASPELLRVALSEAHEEVAAERKVMRLLNDQIDPDGGAPDDATGDAVLELGDELLEVHGAPDVPVAAEPERIEPRLHVGLDRDEFLRNVGRADVPMGAALAPHADADPVDGPAEAGPTNMVSELRRELLQPAIENDEVLDEIQEALRDGRVSVFLQPVVSLPTRKVAFYESFSRIRAADGTVIGPERYIPVAEKEGLVSAIDNNLLFRCIQLVRKTRQRNRDYRFFCNIISPHTLRDCSFFPQFIEFMGENEDLAESLIFVLSQDDLAAMDEEVELNLQALAAIGFSFSMDRVNRIDLNFENLARCQFRYVKIESNILHALMDEDDEAVELELLQARINRTGIDLVVEKIETEQQLVDFLDFPIAFGQGYLFGELRLSKIDA